MRIYLLHGSNPSSAGNRIDAAVCRQQHQGNADRDSHAAFTRGGGVGSGRGDDGEGMLDVCDGQFDLQRMFTGAELVAGLRCVIGVGGELISVHIDSYEFLKGSGVVGGVGDVFDHHQQTVAAAFLPCEGDVVGKYVIVRAACGNLGMLILLGVTDGAFLVLFTGISLGGFRM